MYGFAAGVEEKQKELKEVKEDINQTKDQIQKIEERQKQVAQELSIIEDQLDENQAALEKSEQDLADAQEELRVAEMELQQAIEDAQEYKQLMDKRLRAMYMVGTSSYLEILLKSKNLNDFLDRIHIIGKILSYDKGILESLNKLQETIKNKKEIIEDKKRNIEEAKEEILKQKQSMEQAKNRKELLLRDLDDEKDESQKDLEQLEELSREIEKAIREIQAQEAARKKEQQKAQQREQQKEQQSEQQSSPTQYSGGKMAWPVPGFYRITSSYGYRIHPVSQERKLHTGIDIGSNYDGNEKNSIYGADFVAAEDGTVIFAGLKDSLTSGYGRCVIIDHGGGISTLYGHGSKILVKVGQKVKRGQAVMKVGSSGTSTGAHAHFEVRKNGTPVNPMDYLK